MEGGDRLGKIDGPVGSNLDLFISTLGPLSLGNDDMAREASHRVFVYWIHSKVVAKESPSYAVLRSGS